MPRITPPFGKYRGLLMPRITIPFGKYKGEHPEDVPTDYLQWFLTNVEDIDHELVNECEAQLRARKGEGIER